MTKKNKNKKYYQIPEIPEERKLVFSDNSDSSEDDQSKNKTVKFSVQKSKERRKNKLNSMAEVSESAERD